MSASEPERTHAADDKSEERFQRYFPVASLGGAPSIIVFNLMNNHKLELEQLPLALQWVLVALIFAGLLFMIAGLVLPRWRSNTGRVLALRLGLPTRLGKRVAKAANWRNGYYQHKRP